MRQILTAFNNSYFPPMHTAEPSAWSRTDSAYEADVQALLLLYIEILYPRHRASRVDFLHVESHGACRNFFVGLIRNLSGKNILKAPLCQPYYGSMQNRAIIQICVWAPFIPCSKMFAKSFVLGQNKGHLLDVTVYIKVSFTLKMLKRFFTLLLLFWFVSVSYHRLKPKADVLWWSYDNTFCFSLIGYCIYFL